MWPYLVILQPIGTALPANPPALLLGQCQIYRTIAR